MHFETVRVAPIFMVPGGVKGSQSTGGPLMSGSSTLLEGEEAMKGLASVLLVFVLLGITGIAGPLELSFGGGPSYTSLDSFNKSIGAFNKAIERLNETFDVHPDVSGTVAPMPSMGTGMYLSAAEQYRLTDWFALGAHVEYMGSSSATTGFYQGSEISQIDVSYRSHVLGVVLGGDVTFVDLGLRLGATGGVGYFHAILDRNAIFQIPAEYPDAAIAGLPPEGEGRYTGGTFGLEAGITLSYPIFDWFTIGTQVIYRTAQVDSLKTSQGIALDLNGDGQGESVNLSGIAVQFTFSINIDLSLDGGKESLQ